MAELVGIEKILTYLNSYEFRRVLIQRGTNNLHDWRIKPGESKQIIIEKFADWLEEQPENNFKEYKLRVFGSYSENPDAKLTEFLNTTFSVYAKPDQLIAPYQKTPATTGAPMDVEKYVSVAVENARLRAEIDRMEEKLDEIINAEDEEETEQHPESIGAALNVALMQKLPVLIDALLIRIMGGAAAAATEISPGIGNLDPTPSILDEFKKIHPEIESDLIRLYNLAIKQPEFFKMLITNLRSMA